MYFFIFFIFILLLVMVPKRSIAEKKGIEGEKLVIKKINKLSKKNIILNDLLINYKDSTTQIDHIIISKKGVFVIETKNYSGEIYGDANEKYWIQLLNGYENSFYNPIWQNNTHVRAVKKSLEKVNGVPIYSIVVFCGQCKLKKIRGSREVVSLRRLNRYIKSIKSDRYLNNEEIKYIKDALEKGNIKSTVKRKKHINNMKKRY